MIRKVVHYSIAIVFVFVFAAGPAGLGTALAEEPAPLFLPGTVEGVGVLFEVTDSDYLNVALASTELVAVYLSSIPSVIELRLEAAEGALATELSLSGLVPGFEYHLYTDDLHNHAVMTADAAGGIAWSQDLVDPHLIFIQTVPSTYFINGEDGGECTNPVYPHVVPLGDWDGSTCTLTRDVEESIQIDDDNITLDGAGYTLIGPEGNAAGVLISDGTDVTVKNLTIDGFANGIYLRKAESCFIRGNTIKNVTGTGIVLLWHHKWGDGVENRVTGNQILNAPRGIESMHSANTFIRNTVHSAVHALDHSGNENLGTFYNNNLIDNEDLFFRSNGLILNDDLPFGGNYWSNYDLCVDDGDGYCDEAYSPKNENGQTAGVDLYPWAKPDGWLDISLTGAVIDQDGLTIADPLMVGSTVEFSADFFDIDPETIPHSAVWDWGDGETSPAVVVDSSEIPGAGNVNSAQHTYYETGVYEIKLTMKEDKYLSTVVERYQYVVVYDPSAGFVTGGGWFESPVGAYVLDPDATGQATFGFISKYNRVRGVISDLPDGNTVFEFHAGDPDLRFTSNDYDWLVVAQRDGLPKAIYRGTGSINGTGSYEFMLTAQDFGDDGDMFRIQIWEGDPDSGPETGLIYDNKDGADPNDMYAGTVIGEGSIIIQTKSK